MTDPIAFATITVCYQDLDDEDEPQMLYEQITVEFSNADHEQFTKYVRAYPKKVQAYLMKMDEGNIE